MATLRRSLGQAVVGGVLALGVSSASPRPYAFPVLAALVAWWAVSGPYYCYRHYRRRLRQREREQASSR